MLPPAVFRKIPSIGRTDNPERILLPNIVASRFAQKRRTASICLTDMHLHFHLTSVYFMNLQQVEPLCLSKEHRAR